MEPGNRGRGWLAALPQLIPRHRWTRAFAVTPATTVLAWHRRLVAPQRDLSRRPGRGRPPAMAATRNWSFAMARMNPGRGHRRIQGEPARLGHTIAHSTVWKILKMAEIDATPRRSGPTWSELRPAPPGCPALSGCRAAPRARRTTAPAPRPEAARTGLDEPAHRQAGLPGRLDRRRHARRPARPGGRHSHARRPSGRYGYWPAACSTKTSRRKPTCDVCRLRVSVRVAN